MTDLIVEVPRDVEADVVQHFLAYGLDAQTELTTKRAPGMIRVTRTGGDLQGPTQDTPQVLVETWADTSTESWGMAVTAWALLSVALQQHELNGVELYDADIDVPRTLDDDYAPDLHRHQFLVTLTMPLTELTLTVEGIEP